MTRISDWAKAFNMEVIPFAGKPGDTVFRVVDLFTTENGSWEPMNRLGSVPWWARDKYLKATSDPQYNDDGGADHHIFGAVEAENGGLYPFFPIEFWTYNDNSNRTVQQAKKHGWANIVMYSSANFVYERGERGPWAWKPAAVNADIVVGAGMPSKHHISFWAVWKAEVVQGEPVEPDKPIEKPTGDLELRVQQLEATVGKLRMLMGQWTGD